jgi:hypothetical protein
MSEIGTKLPIQDVRYSVAIGGKADIHRVDRESTRKTHMRHGVWFCIGLILA